MGKTLPMLGAMGLLLCAAGHAAPPPPSTAPIDASKPALTLPVSRDPLSGIVINRTVTVLGRDFYQFFAAAWRDQPDGTRYTVSVHERPTAQRGSEMWVQYGQRRVFHAYLSPQRSAARPVSRRAAAIALKNVIDIDVARLLFRDTDLGAEEL
ncbi:hypothetical protein IMZ29_00615 [Achromobacter sp. GG226]|uniref:curli production assembly/transport protein CsgE n=1 Tax=Verticiella alkaliphila TaxID=2779529 RepID=UPI001C0E2D6F|nr:curli production assembly/transport protein CsgE [Verticiella sp. GG226]MBU4609104.1 hypothetical protein [Verticiella sp. GG226]